MFLQIEKKIDGCGRPAPKTVPQYIIMIIQRIWSHIRKKAHLKLAVEFVYSFYFSIIPTPANPAITIYF